MAFEDAIRRRLRDPAELAGRLDSLKEELSRFASRLDRIEGAVERSREVIDEIKRDTDEIKTREIPVSGAVR